MRVYVVLGRVHLEGGRHILAIRSEEETAVQFAEQYVGATWPELPVRRQVNSFFVGDVLPGDAPAVSVREYIVDEDVTIDIADER